MNGDDVRLDLSDYPVNETTLVNLRTRPGSGYVLIDRRTIYGNPYKITSICTREESIEKFKKYFENRMRVDSTYRAAVETLRGSRLACWCTPLACHGDVYVEYFERTQ